MSNIDYLRIYADAEGCSHFEINTVDLASQDYAPPAPAHLDISKLNPGDVIEVGVADDRLEFQNAA